MFILGSPTLSKSAPMWGWNDERTSLWFGSLWYQGGSCKVDPMNRNTWHTLATVNSLTGFILNYHFVSLFCIKISSHLLDSQLKTFMDWPIFFSSFSTNIHTYIFKSFQWEGSVSSSDWLFFLKSQVWIQNLSRLSIHWISIDEPSMLSLSPVQTRKTPQICL